MSGVAHVAGYLKALAEACPTTRLYTLHAVRLGSDVQGWKLGLYLTVPGLEAPVYLEDDDLEKPVEQLVRETVELIKDAMALKRALAAKNGGNA